MKVFLKAYTKKNLGDDIFIKMLTNRYKKIEFYSHNDASYLNLKNYKYIKENSKRISKLLKKISFGKYENKNLKNYDTSILIGGSMFMEKKNRLKSYFSMFSNNDNFEYIIGINFGPYYTKMYEKKHIKMFEKSKDVCFRDYYSYNLFKNINNTRYAPDIVFSFDCQKYINEHPQNIAIISVIDVSKKVSPLLYESYKETIYNCILSLSAKGFEIVLMSFCKNEGDESAINDIIGTYGLENKVQSYFYSGNIDEALYLLGNSKVIIGSRFHANILGLIMNKVVIPMAYSDKTINVLNDIHFKGKVIDIRKINDFNINDITDEVLTYKCNVEYQKKEAKKHFEKLDIVLGYKNKKG